MNPEIFDAVQSLLDKIAEMAEKQFDSKDLRRLMADLGKAVGKGKAVSLNLVVDVFEEGRECSLPLLTTGLSVLPGKEPFCTWDDSTPQRYIVEDGIQVVPHDRCPIPASLGFQIAKSLQSALRHHPGGPIGEKDS